VSGALLRPVLAAGMVAFLAATAMIAGLPGDEAPTRPESSLAPEARLEATVPQRPTKGQPEGDAALSVRGPSPDYVIFRRRRLIRMFRTPILRRSHLPGP
jgi:hypothetical protein